MDIARAYDDTVEYQWHRLERHRTEYALTCRVLRDHLPPPPARIADIGGGVGRYAIALASQGYAVTPVDISPKSLAFARSQAAEAGVSFEACLEATATDLRLFPAHVFDAVLLMGPLYHLLEHGERLRAVRETHRILRPRSPVFASFINRFSVVMQAIVHRPSYVHDGYDELCGIISNGLYHKRPDGAFMDAWYAHPREITPLMRDGGFSQLDLISCESLAVELEDNIVDTSFFSKWLDVLYAICRETCILGAAGHLIYVGLSSDKDSHQPLIP